jgi:uncharacterized YceG family protein
VNDSSRTPEEREQARLERERARRTRAGLADDTSVERLPRHEPATAPAHVAPPPPAPPTRPPDRRPNMSPGGAGYRTRRLALAAALVIVLLVVWFFFALFQPFKGDGEGSVPVNVPRGATVGEIGDLLADKDVVSSSFMFGVRARLSGRASEFQSGRFVFPRNTNYANAIDTLANEPNAKIVRLTVPEGRSRYEIAEQAANAGVNGDYMAASRDAAGFDPRHYGTPRDADSLEGFLFPATYELPAGADATQLVKQQLRAFKNNVAGVSFARARAKNLTVYDVLTIASLIEREVQSPAERRLVAAVIYNRLKQGIPLGIDATTRFETRNWSEPLTNAQLRSDSPYNTRTRRGLPPTPIGNPGLAAIEAAARPARVSYLYYVANPCKPGTHSFSSTYAEFQRDVQRYNDARARAGGKAPSGC